MMEKNDYYVHYYAPGKIDNHGDGKRLTTFAGDGHMRCCAWMQKVHLHPKIPGYETAGSGTDISPEF